ncbi:MAG: Sensor protein [Hyphomicrobiales bacterium]|nr:Sensor protein [Hyphomicrobiales bacterium]
MIHLPSENTSSSCWSGIAPLRYGAAMDDRATLSTPARVLIVEDELFVALDIEQMVEDLGAESLGIARDAEEAIQLAFEKKPEVILMDVNLGAGRTGTEAAQAILARLPCRVVFITAYRDPSNLERMRQITGEPVLTKPVDQERLRAVLNRTPSPGRLCD